VGPFKTIAREDKQKEAFDKLLRQVEELQTMICTKDPLVREVVQIYGDFAAPKATGRAQQTKPAGGAKSSGTPSMTAVDVAEYSRRVQSGSAREVFGFFKGMGALDGLRGVVRGMTWRRSDGSYMGSLEHTEEVANALDRLATGDYEYFNNRRSGSAELRRDDFEKVRAVYLELVSNPETREILQAFTTLHDIGKARQGDHWRDGSEMVAPVLRSVGMGEDKIRLIQELILKHTDFGDIYLGEGVPERVASNSDIVQRILLIFSICDVTAVGDGKLTANQLETFVSYTDSQNLAALQKDWGKTRLVSLLGLEISPTITSYESAVPQAVRDGYEAIPAADRAAFFDNFMGHTKYHGLVYLVRGMKDAGRLSTIMRWLYVNAVAVNRLNNISGQGIAIDQIWATSDEEAAKIDAAIGGMDFSDICHPVISEDLTRIEVTGRNAAGRQVKATIPISLEDGNRTLKVDTVNISVSSTEPPSMTAAKEAEMIAFDQRTPAETLAKLGIPGDIEALAARIRQETDYTDSGDYIVSAADGRIKLPKPGYDKSTIMHKALYAHEIIHWLQRNNLVTTVAGEGVAGKSELVSEAVLYLTALENGIDVSDLDFRDDGPGLRPFRTVMGIIETTGLEADEAAITEALKDAFASWRYEEDDSWGDRVPLFEEALSFVGDEVWQRFRGIALAALAYRTGQLAGSKEVPWAYIREFIKNNGLRYNLLREFVHGQRLVIGLPWLASTVDNAFNADTEAMRTHLQNIMGSGIVVEVRRFEDRTSFAKAMEKEGVKGVYVEGDGIKDAAEISAGAVGSGILERDILIGILNKITEDLQKIAAIDIDRALAARNYTALRTASAPYLKPVTALVRSTQDRAVKASRFMSLIPTESPKPQVAMSITETNAMYNPAAIRHLEEAINSGMGGYFNYGNVLKTEEEAIAFLRAKGYRGDIDTKMLVNIKGKTYNETIEETAAREAKEGRGNSKIGIASTTEDFESKDEVVSAGVVLEAAPVGVSHGRNIYATEESDTILLSILLDKDIPLPPKDARGIYKLPRPAKVDLDALEAYRSAVMIVMAAA
jgi:hypothetical protein